jgi:hypothetical protein
LLAKGPAQAPDLALAEPEPLRRAGEQRRAQQREGKREGQAADA